VLDPSANSVGPGSSAGRNDVNYYEDFEIGRRFQHHWGRTITAEEAIAFATQHVLHEPALFNRTYAQHLQHPDLVVSPFLVFAVVLGMSVADLSESGGPFLGADALRMHGIVVPGDTLFSSSTVVSRRPSKSQPGYGVVEWETVGTRTAGDRVISFRRTNLVRRRDAPDRGQAGRA
jgi:acyl dehydratase